MTLDPQSQQILSEIQGKVENLVNILNTASNGTTRLMNTEAILDPNATEHMPPPGGAVAPAGPPPALLESLTELMSSVSEHDIYQAIPRGAANIVGARRGFLMVMEDGKKLRWKAGHNVAQEQLMGGNWDGSRSIIKDVVKGGEAVLRGPEGQPISISMVEVAMESALCVPIPIGRRIQKSNSKNNVAGVIYVDSHGMPTGLNKGHLEQLTQFAQYASLALENAWLYTQK